MPKRLITTIAIAVLATRQLQAGLRSDSSKPAFANEVKITLEGDKRVIRSNGIPDHLTGQFPGSGNPNTISPQRYEFRVPAEPKAAPAPTAMRMQPFGVAVNGVVFDPGAAEWWHGDHAWQYEPLKLAPLYLGTDASHAHVQPSGAYHYHGIPVALVYALTGGKDKTVLVGWAADGFPIYNTLGLSDPKNSASPLKALKSSYQIKKGTRPSGPGGAYDGKFVADYEYVAGSGDLDECNGLVGITPDYPMGIYHYVLTEDFPYIPRLYRGTPDDSFARHPRGGQGFAQGGGPGGGGPGGGPLGGGPQGGGGGGAPGGPGGGPPGGFHLIPLYAMVQLTLTPDQQQQVTALETEEKSKLAKILSAEQMKTLEESRPPRPGQRGAQGPQSPPGSDPQGGPGGSSPGWPRRSPRVIRRDIPRASMNSSSPGRKARDEREDASVRRSIPGPPAWAEPFAAIRYTWFSL